MALSLRERAGNIWLEYLSTRRKDRIYRETDPSLVMHLKPVARARSKWYGTSYGGFYIIPELLNESSVIYSFGTGRDVSFDLACIKRHKASVFAFDPTPKSIEWIRRQKLPDRFHFNPYGISAAESGLADFFLPANPRGISGSLVSHSEVDIDSKVTVMMKSFDDITSELNHIHIDVLKMDIEGSEYEVLDTIINSPVTVDQLLIEFHDRNFSQTEYRSRESVSKLSEAGYQLFGCSRSFEEISFVHSRKNSSLK